MESLHPPSATAQEYPCDDAYDAFSHLLLPTTLHKFDQDEIGPDSAFLAYYPHRPKSLNVQRWLDHTTVFMPSRFDPEPNPKQPEDDSRVDVSKRYDVYCSQHGSGVLAVYRNVRFRRARTLLGMGGHLDVISQVIELEQANGQTVFISRHGIVRFCEHGTELLVELVPIK
jgi:hypothetical protein